MLLEIVGRRVVLSNMTDVERLEQNFHERAKRRSEFSLSACIGETWNSFADHVRSLVHAHAKTGSVIRDPDLFKVRTERSGKVHLFRRARNRNARTEIGYFTLLEVVSIP